MESKNRKWLHLFEKRIKKLINYFNYLKISPRSYYFNFILNTFDVYSIRNGKSIIKNFNKYEYKIKTWFLLWNFRLEWKYVSKCSSYTCPPWFYEYSCKGTNKKRNYARIIHINESSNSWRVTFARPYSCYMLLNFIKYEYVFSFSRTSCRYRRNHSRKYASF